MIGRRARLALLLAKASLFSFSLGVVHCSSGGVTLVDPDGSAPQPDAGGDSGPVGPGHVPLVHRPSPISCPGARDPGFNFDGGRPDAGGGGEPCARDSDCTAGTNGRCLRYSRINAYYCSYDVCANDGACPAGQTCNCGAAGTPTRAGNACLPGNCRVDGDCGAGGYCSPSLDPSCGSYFGITGYYCHSASDECTNDSECTAMGTGFCAFTPMVSKWVCHYGVCAG